MVYGASFTDIHAQLPVLTLMIFVSLVGRGAGRCPAPSAPSSPWPWPGVGILLGVGFVGNQGYPYLIQTFEVAPNEISKESPYIEYAVKHTRMAYGIDRVKEEEFPALENLTAETLKQNEQTMQNIRLWDHQPLLQTYGQLQIIRPYYDFVDVDNDRYWIDGEYRQVSLSPRELSSESLPSRIWINEHLTYTHGYGICQGPVNQFTQEGLPTFMIKDIPPASVTDIKVTRPEIYYGELSHSYCFVKTHAKEFDYPSGDENVFTDYQGEGGIPVGGFLRKLLFGLYFKEPKIILSSDIHAGSRLMFDRAVAKRLRKLLPFLRYDSDPYMVISDEGKLFWIVDGYTVSSLFPYSQPVRGPGQLHPKRGQGHHRRLQRHGSTLRERSRRPSDQGLLQDLSRRIPAPGGDARGPQAAPALPRGPLPRPGQHLRHLPHDRPSGLLQQGGPVAHPHPVPAGGRHSPGSLLHHHEAQQRGGQGRVHPDDSLDPGPPGKHDRLDGRPLRRSQLRGTGGVQVPQAAAGLRSPPRSWAASTRKPRSPNSSLSGGRVAPRSSGAACW